MITALDLENEETFRKEYAEWKALLPTLSQEARSASDNQCVDILHQAIQKKGIHPYVVIFGLEKLPEQELNADQKSAISLSIRNELVNIGQEHFDAEHQKLLETVVDEVVEELYEDPATSKRWRKQILDDSHTYYADSLFSPTLLERDFSEWRETALGFFCSLGHLVGTSFGSYGPQSKQLNFSVIPGSALEARKTIKHELVHYLMDHGEIKLPADFEQMTYAVDVLEHVKHAAETIEAGEESLKQTTEIYEPAVYELYMRGKELGRKGEMGFLVRPGVSDDRAGWYAIDALVAEARGVYEQKGRDATPLLEAYAAQRAAGIMTAGILMGMSETHVVKPLALLRDFFAVLHERSGIPDADFLHWIDKELTPEIKNYAEYLVGQKLDFLQRRKNLSF